MFPNFLRVALRQMRKQGFYTAINIGGFALGIATCLLIALYIHHETSYDRDYPNGDRLYRIYESWDYRGNTGKGTAQAAPFAQTLKNEFPEVELAGRVMPYALFWGAGSNEVMPEGKVNDTYEEGFAYADQSMLDMLQTPMVYGERAHALTEPLSIVISRRKADKLFPGVNPVGKLIYLNDDKQHPYKVGGVMQDPPANTQFQYDFFLTLTGKEMWNGEQQTWDATNYETFLQLRPDADPSRVEAKLHQLLKEHWLPEMLKDGTADAQGILAATHLHIQPLKDVHLASDIDDGHSHGDVRLIWLFGAVAGFILILACINFINLSTARSTNRAREVGIRKVVGSRRAGLIWQFLLESLLLSYFAFVLAIGLVFLLRPLFGQLAGTTLTIPYNDWQLIPGLILAATMTGLLAGLYPSIYLSRFRPIEVLRGTHGFRTSSFRWKGRSSVSRGSRHSALRSVLVVFQFTTSVILIVATLVVSRQMQFLLNRKLGFDKSQVMLIQGTGPLDKQLTAFKTELLKLEGVKNVSVSDFLPVTGGKRNMNTFYISGQEKTGFGTSAQSWWVDPDYLATMGMHLVAGRMFSASIASDSTAIVINETMAKQLGFKDPLGKEITTGWKQHIIGMVADFNFESMKQQVGPLVLHRGDWATVVAVKANGADMASLIGKVARVWKSFSPHQELRYTFLDESLARMYMDVQRTGNIFTSFASLAIIIACLGLFALSAYMAEQRRKEIGIRKVLGATIRAMMSLLSKDFAVLIGIAILIASPIAWWLMHRWLQDFAYRVDIGVLVFVIAGGLVIGIAFVTMSVQLLRAATANPAPSLRME
jgi:putative ABC transport system permease protein